MKVYKTTNKINGKVYIGQSSKDDPLYLGSGFLIRRAIRKYGRDSFIKEILSVCASKEVLDWMERFWISVFDSTNLEIGYNITSGGTGGDTITNHPNRAEIVQKISERVRGENNPMYGKHHSEVTRKIISEKERGERHWLYGKHRSPETIQKTADANRGKKRSDESRKKMSESAKGNQKWLGKHHSEKARAKMSMSHTGKKLSDVTKQRMGVSQSGRTHSEETKRKMSESRRMYWIKRKQMSEVL